MTLLALIDAALASLGGRTLMSADEMADALLDIRTEAAGVLAGVDELLAHPAVRVLIDSAA